MKFCKNCGQQTNDDAMFCTNCGHSFQDENMTPNSTEHHKEKIETKPQHPPAPRKPMSKMQKVLISIFSIVIVAGIIAHLVVSNHYDPAKKIEVMNSAYNNQDKETFFNQFHFKEGTVANAQDFYSTVNEYGWANLRNNLTNEIEKIKKKEHTDIIYNEGEFISVHKKPVLFGLYNDVEFTVIPIDVRVHAPYEGMTITFGEKEVVSQKEDEEIIIGNFIPGTYEWTYEYENGIMPMSGKGSDSLYYNWDNTAFVDVDWNFTSISVDSDLEDAVVYVAGKSTGKKISELYTLYPVQVNPAVEIYAVAKDKDGNEVKSDILPLDSEYIYLPFEYVQKEQRLAEQEQEIRNLYKRFRSDYSTAIYYANFNYIEEYFKDGSKIQKDYAKFVTDHNDIPDYYYDFLVNDITDFTVVSDNKFELKTFETFNFSSESDGYLHYERIKKYVFSYIDDEIFIDEIIDLDTKKSKY